MADERTIFAEIEAVLENRDETRGWTVSNTP